MYLSITTSKYILTQTEERIMKKLLILSIVSLFSTGVLAVKPYTANGSNGGLECMINTGTGSMTGYPCGNPGVTCGPLLSDCTVDIGGVSHQGTTSKLRDNKSR
jgi:hypothetical protein